jgi:transposase
LSPPVSPPAARCPLSNDTVTDLGAKVIVANPRKLHAISRSERKCDRRDAQMLARLARVDPALLLPIEHGSARAQHDLLGLKLRDALVRTRVNLINAVRFTLKSLGHPLRNPSSESFHKSVLADVPADCLPVVQPLLALLAQVTEQIKGLERDLVQRSKTDYPATQRLQQITGVGPLTALCFVLRPATRNDSVVAGMPALISGCVSAAHYVLGPFGPPCALREHGQRLTGTGSAREKKRAVVAIARKLAVLLLSLWKHGTNYEPRVSAVVLTPA